MLTTTAEGGCASSLRGPKITAIDTHAHVFAHNLPLAWQHRYAPDYDALLSDYLAQLDTHRISNGVLVQPSFLGTDNRYLSAALAAQPERLRGIAVIDPAAAAAEPAQLDALARLGIVGIRLNLFSVADPDYRSTAWQAVLPKIAELGWQVEVHCEAARLPQVVRPLIRANIDVVVDHFGRPEPALGVNDPGFRYLLALGSTRRVWVKLSGAYRNGANGVGDATAEAATPLLKDALGLDRLVWGSDWPHTQFEATIRYDPAYRLIQRLLPDERERHVVLVETPAKLFGFRGSTSYE